jgi:hypothetical protein
MIEKMPQQTQKTSKSGKMYGLQQGLFQLLIIKQLRVKAGIRGPNRGPF